jgi:hypothetical protein
METNQRKIGRPKKPARTGPLVLGIEGARTKVTLEISEQAASELAEYTQWVEEYARLDASEARFKTVDYALREVFRRDSAWQARRREATAPRPAAPSASPATPPTATTRTPSPSLPPPPPRDPRTSA